MALSVHRKPLLSVVVASYNSKRTIARCLSSLESQVTDGDFEVVVVDSSTDGTARVVEEEFPQVRLCRFSDRKYCGDARNIGVALARGDIIAFTDADCTADSQWVDEILKAHESSQLAIGGAIANADPSGVVGWAAYFCEFSQWMPGTGPRWLDDIAGANMSYKKEAFGRYGPFLEGTYCSDTDFHWRLGQDAHRLRFVPQIVVSHYSISSLREFMEHEFDHGRSFARVRIRGQGFSTPRRLAYVVLSPLIPLRILLKVLLNNIRNRIYLPRFIRALPLVVAGVLSWSAGEVVGYAGGDKKQTAYLGPEAG
jgi:GT2 family glycosyltransferase